MKKLLIYYLVVTLVFTQIFFGVPIPSAEAQESGAIVNSLMVVVVDKRTYAEIESELLQYAQDVQRDLAYLRVKFLQIDADEKPINIYRSLERYYRGIHVRPGPIREYLRGVVLVGEVPIPDVRYPPFFDGEDERIAMSVFPYVDFDRRAFFYNEETEEFERVGYGMTPKADIWHGVIRPPHRPHSNDWYDDLRFYFQKNHLLRNAEEYPFEKKIGVFHEPHKKENELLERLGFYLVREEAWKAIAWMSSDLLKFHPRPAFQYEVLNRNTTGLDLYNLLNEITDPWGLRRQDKNFSRILSQHKTSTIQNYLTPFLAAYEAFMGDIESWIKPTGRWRNADISNVELELTKLDASHRQSLFDINRRINDYLLLDRERNFVVGLDPSSDDYALLCSEPVDERNMDVCFGADDVISYNQDQASLGRYVGKIQELSMDVLREIEKITIDSTFDRRNDEESEIEYESVATSIRTFYKKNDTYPYIVEFNMAEDFQPILEDEGDRSVDDDEDEEGPQITMEDLEEAAGRVQSGLDSSELDRRHRSDFLLDASEIKFVSGIERERRIEMPDIYAYENVDDFIAYLDDLDEELNYYVELRNKAYFKDFVLEDFNFRCENQSPLPPFDHTLAASRKVIEDLFKTESAWKEIIYVCPNPTRMVNRAGGNRVREETLPELPLRATITYEEFLNPLLERDSEYEEEVFKDLVRSRIQAECGQVEEVIQNVEDTIFNLSPIPGNFRVDCPAIPVPDPACVRDKGQERRELSCVDGRDNDCDGVLDRDDVDCFNAEVPKIDFSFVDFRRFSSVNLNEERPIILPVETAQIARDNRDAIAEAYRWRRLPIEQKQSELFAKTITGTPYETLYVVNKGDVVRSDFELRGVRFDEGCLAERLTEREAVVPTIGVPDINLEEFEPPCETFDVNQTVTVNGTFLENNPPQAMYTAMLGMPAGRVNESGYLGGEWLFAEGSKSLAVTTLTENPPESIEQLSPSLVFDGEPIEEDFFFGDIDGTTDSALVNPGVMFTTENKSMLAIAAGTEVGVATFKMQAVSEILLGDPTTRINVAKSPNELSCDGFSVDVGYHLDRTNELVIDIEPIDFNGDGRKDIMAVLNSGRVLFYENARTEGHFVPLGEYLFIPEKVQDATAGDFEQDGLEDIIFATGEPTYLLYYRNTGDGFERIELPYETGSVLYSVVSEDLDPKDGREDVGFSDSRGGVYFLENIRNGLFRFDPDRSIDEGQRLAGVDNYASESEISYEGFSSPVASIMTFMDADNRPATMDIHVDIVDVVSARRYIGSVVLEMDRYVLDANNEAEKVTDRETLSLIGGRAVLRGVPRSRLDSIQEFRVIYDNISMPTMRVEFSKVGTNTNATISTRSYPGIVLAEPNDLEMRVGSRRIDGRMVNGSASLDNLPPINLEEVRVFVRPTVNRLAQVTMIFSGSQPTARITVLSQDGRPVADGSIVELTVKHPGGEFVRRAETTDNQAEIPVPFSLFTTGDYQYFADVIEVKNERLINKTYVSLPLDENLGTSQKTYTDLNGGFIDVGDRVRVDIDLNSVKDADITGVDFKDSLPSFLRVVSEPREYRGKHRDGRIYFDIDSAFVDAVEATRNSPATAILDPIPSEIVKEDADLFVETPGLKAQDLDPEDEVYVQLDTNKDVRVYLRDITQKVAAVRKDGEADVIFPYRMARADFDRSIKVVYSQTGKPLFRYRYVPREELTVRPIDHLLYFENLRINTVEMTATIDVVDYPEHRLAFNEIVPAQITPFVAVPPGAKTFVNSELDGVSLTEFSIPRNGRATISYFTKVVQTAPVKADHCNGELRRTVFNRVSGFVDNDGDGLPDDDSEVVGEEDGLDTQNYCAGRGSDGFGFDVGLQIKSICDLTGRPEHLIPFSECSGTCTPIVLEVPYPCMIIDMICITNDGPAKTVGICLNPLICIQFPIKLGFGTEKLSCDEAPLLPGVNVGVEMGKFGGDQDDGQGLDIALSMPPTLWMPEFLPGLADAEEFINRLLYRITDIPSFNVEFPSMPRLPEEGPEGNDMASLLAFLDSLPFVNVDNRPIKIHFPLVDTEGFEFFKEGMGGLMDQLFNSLKGLIDAKTNLGDVIDGTLDKLNAALARLASFDPESLVNLPACQGSGAKGVAQGIRGMLADKCLQATTLADSSASYVDLVDKHIALLLRKNAEMAQRNVQGCDLRPSMNKLQTYKQQVLPLRDASLDQKNWYCGLRSEMALVPLEDFSPCELAAKKIQKIRELLGQIEAQLEDLKNILSRLKVSGLPNVENFKKLKDKITETLDEISAPDGACLDLLTNNPRYLEKDSAKTRQGIQASRADDGSRQLDDATGGGGQSVVDLSEIESEFEAFASSLELVAGYPAKICEFIDLEKKYLEQIMELIGLMSEFQESIEELVGEKLDEWKEFLTFIPDFFNEMMALIRLIMKYLKECEDDCTDGRNASLKIKLLMELLGGVIPNLSFPAIPTFPDFHFNFKTNLDELEIPFPSVEFVGKPMVLPMPPLPQLPNNGGLLSALLDQIGDAAFDLVDALQAAALSCGSGFDDIGNDAAFLNDVSAKFSSLQVIDSVSPLPPMPVIDVVRSQLDEAQSLVGDPAATELRVTEICEDVNAQYLALPTVLSEDQFVEDVNVSEFASSALESDRAQDLAASVCMDPVIGNLQGLTETLEFLLNNKFKISLGLPVFPELPSLPTLPEVPTIEFPEIPELPSPPQPPSIPTIPTSLIEQGITIYCLLTSGQLIHPEPYIEDQAVLLTKPKAVQLDVSLGIPPPPSLSLGLDFGDYTKLPAETEFEIELDIPLSGFADTIAELKEQMDSITKEIIQMTDDIMKGSPADEIEKSTDVLKVPDGPKVPDQSLNVPTSFLDELFDVPQADAIEECVTGCNLLILETINHGEGLKFSYTDFDNDGDEDLIYAVGRDIYFKHNRTNFPGAFRHYRVPKPEFMQAQLLREVPPSPNGFSFEFVDNQEVDLSWYSPMKDAEDVMGYQIELVRHTDRNARLEYIDLHKGRTVNRNIFNPQLRVEEDLPVKRLDPEDDFYEDITTGAELNLYDTLYSRENLAQALFEDGSRINFYPGNKHKMFYLNNVYTSSHKMKLPNGLYFGRIRSYDELGNRSLPSEWVLISPAQGGDETPPRARTAKSSMNIDLFERTIMDGTSSSDAGGDDDREEFIRYFELFDTQDIQPVPEIREYYWDLDHTTDANLDGFVDNDVDRRGPNSLYIGQTLGEKQVSLAVEDSAGNMSRERRGVDIDVESPSIKLLTKDIASEEEVRGETTPGMRVSLMRQRGGLKSDQVREVITDEEGIFVFDGFSFGEPGVKLTHTGEERVYFTVDGRGDLAIEPGVTLSSEIVEAFEATPTYTVIRDELGQDLAYLVYRIDPNTDVLGYVSDVDLGNVLELTEGVYVVDERNDEFTVTPVADGVDILNENDVAVMRVTNGGDIEVTQPNMRLRYRPKDSEEGRDSLSLMMGDIELARVYYVPSERDQVSLHVGGLNDLPSILYRRGVNVVVPPSVTYEGSYLADFIPGDDVFAAILDVNDLIVVQTNVLTFNRSNPK